MSVNDKMRKFNKSEVVNIEEPPVARILFGSVRWAWLWLAARLAIGYVWIQAGWEKLNDPAWFGSDAGSALSGFLQGALGKTGGAHPEVQSWYASFLKDVVLPNARLWSYGISIAEFLVGATLILGMFAGIASFFGLFLNMNYLLAGTVSINPLLLIVEVLLILAWRTAGWFGLDRWLLPALGTPWSPGYVFHIRHGHDRMGHEGLPA